MLILFAIAWAVLLAAASEWLGFSKEVGAFLAGVSLASTAVPGFDQHEAGEPAGLPAAVLLHRPGRPAGVVHGRVAASAASVLLSLFVLVGKPADRDGHHGLDGVSSSHELPRRTDGGPDQRVLPDRRGPRRQPGPHPAADDGPDHPRRRRDDLRVHVHDPLLAEPLPAPRHAAEDLRAEEPLPRGEQQHRDRDDGRRRDPRGPGQLRQRTGRAAARTQDEDHRRGLRSRRRWNDGGPGASRSSTATWPTPISTSSCP